MARSWLLQRRHGQNSCCSAQRLTLRYWLNWPRSRSKATCREKCGSSPPRRLLPRLTPLVVARAGAQAMSRMWTTTSRHSARGSFLQRATLPQAAAAVQVAFWGAFVVALGSCTSMGENVGRAGNQLPQCKRQRGAAQGCGLVPWTATIPRTMSFAKSTGLGNYLC